jgi:ferredoxin
MCKKHIRYTATILLAFFILSVFPAGNADACNGVDVILSEDQVLLSPDRRNNVRDDQGNLLLHRSEVNISPGLAQAIAEKFVTENIPDQPLPLTFRKLESVHGKIIYQFKSEPLDNYNGQYHLGPVNFKVENLVLDVDARTGNLYIATGCGSAPGKLLYTYNPSDFNDTDLASPVFASNNTNFIARDTGNLININGRITPEEWKDTGHKYFYLGEYKPHLPSEQHESPYYYAEVWSRIDDSNIYFAVKTDSPYWVALMFKNDPNLGMLGAYRDAKVMKSNGEVSDRYFAQRQDRTFYLEKDKKDDILLKANYQDDFYTYEIAFPLKTDDPQDISFEKGKAYNFLLLIGNTLEHYGIFTLDKAHANHDHSKNNEEHVDVWASNEETIRIGSPADRDIFGNPISPVFASYVSGFDASKDEQHFHYADTHHKDFEKRSAVTGYISWFTVFMAFFGMGIIINRFRSSPALPDDHESEGGKDLFKINWLRRLVTSDGFRYAFIVPTLIIFILIIFLGLFDVQDGQRNIATVFTWTLWWSLIIFTFIIAGRFWCMMCPFATIGDWAQKLFCLDRKLPKWLQNMGFQTVAFILLTWAFTILAFSSRPFVTALVILFILTAAIIFSMVYQRRSFCRHLCPIGAVIGVYSMVSPLELRASDKKRCSVHKKKDCTDACPMLESPEMMDSNVYCNFCMKCETACPSSNLSLRLRAFGKDIYSGISRSSSIAVAALFLLGVVIVETLAMTSTWKPLESSISLLTGITSPTALYTLIFSIVILLPVGAFYLMCYLLRLWLGREKYETKGLVTEFAFLLIPLGVALHFAHNLQHLLLEGSIAVPATIRFLHNIGIGTSLPINWNPSPLLGLEPIFFIQMSILITGFAFTMFVLYRMLRRFQRPLKHVYKMTIAMSLYALIIVLSSIYMLGLPMSGRHIH